MVTTTSAASGVVVGERLGELPGRVEAAFFEHGDDRRVELVPRLGAGGAHVDAALGVVVEKHLGGQAAPGVVDAEEQTTGLSVTKSPEKVWRLER
jgi:hypothetical protein